jgi:hypothetical protein
MRVEFVTEGGVAYFPGLSRPVVVDSDDLPEADAGELRRLIDAADFFEQPALPRTLPKGAADLRQYTIGVQDGRRRHTIRLVDPIDDSHLQDLVDFLRRHASRPATLGEEPPAHQPRRRGERTKKRGEREVGE